MCFCTGTTEYDPYHEPAPRATTHTAYARPASRSSFHSYNRRSGGHVAALPPPSSRRSYDHHQQHHYRSSTSSMPAERRYVEYHEPQPRHSVQLVERRPRSRSRGVSPGGRTVRTERERVVYV